MALFIHPENQKIIWETIHRHSSIESIHPSVRTDWFKGVVKKMYETIPKPWFQQKMTTEQLNTINQATIKYMINDLKPVILQQPQYTSQQPQPQSYQQFSNNNNNSASIFSENKSHHTSVIQERFIEKQKEMESFMNTKPPSEVNFKIDEIDEPISNMEELIKQHMSQRELDIQPMTSASIHPMIEIQTHDQPSVRDARNVQAPVVDRITTSIISNTEINDKHVTFQEPIDTDVEIQQLKTQIQTIQSDVSQLKTMMHDFLEKLSKPKCSDETSDSCDHVEMHYDTTSSCLLHHPQILPGEARPHLGLVAEPKTMESNSSDAESET